MAAERKTSPNEMCIRDRLVAPFVFWQSLPAGVVFCLLWAALVAVVYQRACSYAAALGAETLTVYSLSLIHI